jgi:hypothetical protein
MISIKIASMKEKAQGLLLHEAKSAWVVLQQDRAPPHWRLIVRQFLDETPFQNKDCEGRSNNMATTLTGH